MLCLCGLPGGEAMNRSDLLRGSGRGSERQRGRNNKNNGGHLEMSVNGIGAAGYPLTGYTARKMETSVEPGTVGFMEAVEEKAAQGRAADQDEKAFEMVGRGAPQEVKDAWMDAAKEVNANGMGIRGNKGKRDCEVDSWEFRL